MSGVFPEEPPAAGGELVARPVLIGHDGPEMDACGSVSKVILVLGEADDQAVVRAAPDGLAREVGRITPGHVVAQCDYSDEPEWFGVVWDPANPHRLDCGTGSPVTEVKEYVGPCLTGWIRADNLEMIAG